MANRRILLALAGFVLLSQTLPGTAAGQPNYLKQKPEWKSLSGLLEARTGHGMSPGRKKLPHPRRPQTQVFRTVPFVFGGQANSRCKDTAEYYDTAARKWKPAARMPTPRCSVVAVTAASGRIYLIGGTSGPLSVDSVDLYDPETDQWSSPGTVPALAKELSHHGAVAMPDGSMYVFGGTADSSQNLARAVYWYREGGTAWERIGDMPVPKSNAVAFTVKGYIFVFGGTNGVSIFKPDAGDPTEGEWSHFATAPEYVQEGAVADGQIYLLFDTGHSSGAISRYTPSKTPLTTAGTVGAVIEPAAGIHPVSSATGLGNSVYTSGGYKKFGGYTNRADRLILPLKVSDEGKGGGWTEETDVSLLNPSGSWSAWLNRDGPSGSGDYETLKELRAQHAVCLAPKAIQCRTVKGKKDWQAAGQVVTCSARTGGVCVNSKNRGGCRDYEVRFLCD